MKFAPASSLLIALVALLCAQAFAAPSWPLQEMPGPDGDPKQDPSTFPRAKAPVAAPVKRERKVLPAFQDAGNGNFALRGAWRLKETIHAVGTAPELSVPGYKTEGWYAATVPGTVLTTLVDEGVYPEPTYGLNNLAIPESLSRQDYWYRNEFILPTGCEGRTLSLRFEGINYAAEVWLNGQKLGNIRGAFMRGEFDVTGFVKANAANALLVRISPPPHPGIPHEESLAAGAGVPNGGSLTADGPTFFCTEGWDWIPGIRDRCSGIWQDVILHVGGPVVLGDVHVKTDLPLPDLSQADVFVSVAVRNQSAVAQDFTVRGEFEGASFEQKLNLAAGASSYAKFGSGEFKDLHVKAPRLWWPNGYGKPELYHLKLSVLDNKGALTESKTMRFGIRQVTYEISAWNKNGLLGRYELNQSAVWNKQLIDKRHSAIHQAPGAWVPSVAEGAESTPGLLPSADLATGPFILIKVNGKPIVCKGGNWGLDEALKRVDRERMEPYFRLERDANMTMVRNWCGQNTEEVFYELADEYGLMVWNDFWLSTQNWNQEPLDLDLFLANAEDVVRRFRNHPSIVIWCGRNEGVPPPMLNEGLDRIILNHDSTRYYQPTSNQVSLLNSGPWVHNEPVKFFSEFGLGFTTELGLPCAPTADAIRAMMPVSEQWPISDTWAYHDWHQAHHGEVQAFMEALELQYGKASDLEDFCRKAQMINYVGHQALFEGLNANLWKPAAGRLIWMSHPTWPSTEWQLYSSDFDPNGAYFGAQKACEPLHVQLNLHTRDVVVANTTLTDLNGARVKAELFDINGRKLASQESEMSAPANQTSLALHLDEKAAAAQALYFVKLGLLDASGRLLSDNFYWCAKTAADHQALNKLPKVSLEGQAAARRNNGVTKVLVHLRNSSGSPVLLIKPTLRDQSGTRILPAYLKDGGFSLLPGEERSLEIETPVAKPAMQVSIDAWNAGGSIPVTE